MHQEPLWKSEEERKRAELWNRLPEQVRDEIVEVLVRLVVQSVVKRAGTQAKQENEP